MCVYENIKYFIVIHRGILHRPTVKRTTKASSNGIQHPDSTRRRSIQTSQWMVVHTSFVNRSCGGVWWCVLFQRPRRRDMSPNYKNNSKDMPQLDFGNPAAPSSTCKNVEVFRFRRSVGYNYICCFLRVKSFFLEVARR